MTDHYLDKEVTPDIQVSFKKMNERKERNALKHLTGNNIKFSPNNAMTYSYIS